MVKGAQNMAIRAYETTLLVAKAFHKGLVTGGSVDKAYSASLFPKDKE